MVITHLFSPPVSQLDFFPICTRHAAPQYGCFIDFTKHRIVICSSKVTFGSNLHSSLHTKQTRVAKIGLIKVKTWDSVELKVICWPLHEIHPNHSVSVYLTIWPACECPETWTRQMFCCWRISIYVLKTYVCEGLPEWHWVQYMPSSHIINPMGGLSEN